MSEKKVLLVFRYGLGIFQAVRDLFSFRPGLTKDQFFSNGYAEKKVIMCTDILTHVRNLHKKLAPKPRVKTAPPSSMTSGVGYGVSSASVNHKIQSASAAGGATARTASMKPPDSSVTPQLLVRNFNTDPEVEANPAPLPVRFQTPRHMSAQGDAALALPIVRPTDAPELPAVPAAPYVHSVPHVRTAVCSLLFKSRL